MQFPVDWRVASDPTGAACNRTTAEVSAVGHNTALEKKMRAELEIADSSRDAAIKSTIAILHPVTSDNNPSFVDKSMAILNNVNDLISKRRLEDQISAALHKDAAWNGGDETASPTDDDSNAPIQMSGRCKSGKATAKGKSRSVRAGLQASSEI